MVRARTRGVVPALLVALALTAAGCSSSGKKASTDTSGSTVAASSTTAASGGYGDSSDTTLAATSTTAGASPTTAAASAPAPAPSDKTVSVASVGKLGPVLVDKNGHTLYLFEKDQGTTSACTGGCVQAWPPLTSPNTPTVGAGVDASKLSTAQGSAPHQVVYNGHLLYTFGGDKNPGDANGVGIPNWYPVKADGTARED